MEFYCLFVYFVCLFALFVNYFGPMDSLPLLKDLGSLGGGEEEEEGWQGSNFSLCAQADSQVW